MVLFGEIVIVICICFATGVFFFNNYEFFIRMNQSERELSNTDLLSPGFDSSIDSLTQIATLPVGEEIIFTPHDIFSPDNMNTLPPEDVLETISYHGTGGPDQPLSNDEIRNQLYCWIDYSVPTILHDVVDGELMSTMKMGSCGWSPGEFLQSMITYPDGEQIASNGFANECGCYLFSHLAELSSPEGVYKIQVWNEHGMQLSTNSLRQLPVVPRLYILNENLLMLHNFLPNEDVRLFLYELSPTAYCEFTTLCWEIYGWKQFTVDNNGNLFINAYTKSGYYIAMDSQGYEIKGPEPGEATGPMEEISVDWEGAHNKWIELKIKEKSYRSCPANTPTKITFPQGEMIFSKNIRSYLKNGKLALKPKLGASQWTLQTNNGQL
jgi:hypothetical protein